MARFAGINVPSNKRILISLTYIFGVGRTTSSEILEKAKIDPNIRTKDLTPDQEGSIRKILDGMVLEGDARRKKQLDIKHLVDAGTYRGYRHRRGLPVRGQRTKTNARTRKGRKKTVANKKKESK